MIIYILSGMIGVSLSTVFPILSGFDIAEYSLPSHYLIGLIVVLATIPWLYEKEPDAEEPTIQFSFSSEKARKRLIEDKKRSEAALTN